VPATQTILRVEPIELDVWVRMAGVAASIIVAIEIHKLVRRAGGSPTTAEPAVEPLDAKFSAPA
jgi:hypothetical protein